MDETPQRAETVDLHSVIAGLCTYGWRSTWLRFNIHDSSFFLLPSSFFLECLAAGVWSAEQLSGQMSHHSMCGMMVTAASSTLFRCLSTMYCVVHFFAPPPRFPSFPFRWRLWYCCNGALFAFGCCKDAAASAGFNRNQITAWYEP